MAKNTKIEWCTATWNIVTGCYHTCEYCYARAIANRFGGDKTEDSNIHVMNERDGYYPYGFEPTFHRYRIGELKQWKLEQLIFVCSMSDLFGEWIPDEWINEVFTACDEAPWHTYMFLTKNPKRYIDLYEKGILRIAENYWYGTTITRADDEFFFSQDKKMNVFLSIEPLQEDLGRKKITALDYGGIKWVILGAESGKRKEKITPNVAWIESIIQVCEKAKVPLFMKKNIEEAWGQPLIKQTPELLM